MNGIDLTDVKAVKACRAGDVVRFRARVLRVWESGGLRMALVGDESALTRVELGSADVQHGRSYAFRNMIVREYPGGWHSASVGPGASVILLDEDVPISQDEAYIERTFKILSGVQRRKARLEGRLPPWRHPSAEESESGGQGTAEG